MHPFADESLRPSFRLAADFPSSLPALLGHVSTTPSFPLDNSPFVSARLCAPSSYRFPPLSVLSSSSSKRPCSHATPNPHVVSAEHTKKRKLRHRYLRSELLLAGPAPLPSTAPSSGPKRPRTTVSAAAWWPSVSQSHGEGTASRFARQGAPEAAECGTGTGWVVQLALRFGGLRVGGAEDEDRSARTRAGRSRSRTRSRSRGRSRERGAAGGRGRADLPRPALPSRANSSPAVFGVSGLRTVYEAPVVEQRQQQQGTVELEGPALKKALLLNLRARMASDGGTSRGAEAGVRFKKCVYFTYSRLLPRADCRRARTGGSCGMRGGRRLKSRRLRSRSS